MKKLNKNVPFIKEFNLDDTPLKSIRNYWLEIITDGFSNPISIPVIVARGKEDGPVLGLTAAVHGNELNGISVIQRLFDEIDVNELKGTIVGIPVVNVPSFTRKKRRFSDGVDLNHIMPGKPDGNVSEVYAYRFFNRIVKHFDYILDLHTASFGRINSYYIRADMSQPITRELALLQNADIIVNNPPSDGTLRGAAAEIGIPSITLEVGNPNTFQKKLIRSGVDGIHNVICHLKMIDDDLEIAEKETVICKSSYWIYTDTGGLLHIQPELRQIVEKDDILAIQRNIFGKKIREYRAPQKGIIIGKSISPVNQTGGRILHLGILED